MLERIYKYLEKKMTFRNLNKWERAELEDRRRADARSMSFSKREARNAFLTGLSLGFGIAALELTIAAIVTAALLR